MIVSRPIQDAIRGVGRNALDLPVAGLAALAALFVAFTLPGDLLAELIGATGLPSILAAAEPPLGLTARIVIAAAGALATFGLVFLLLRVLDRSGLEKPGKAHLRDVEDEAPRARRRDFHPDAPAPRPISAAREFGEPAPPGRPSETAPLWLSAPEPYEAVPAGEPEPVVAEAPEPEPEPEPASEPDPASEPKFVAGSSSTLAELMERLERGLSRRRMKPAASPRQTPNASPQVFPEAPDDRLQSAIDSLQRLAARQS